MTRNEIEPDKQLEGQPQEGFDPRTVARSELPQTAPPQTAPPQTAPPPRTRKRSSAIGTLLTILVIGGLVYAAYHYLIPHGEKTAAPRAGRGGGAPQTVGVATIGKGSIEIDIEALGTVTPTANITVKTQISGQLLRVGFREGQLVKAGDFLAQIDDRPYQALEHQYEGQLVHDQGLLDQAKFDAIRYQTLLNQNSIARQTAEDQKFVVQQYEGTVKADQGLIEAQKVNLAFCHITAPVTGRVGLRQVDPGNYAQTSDTNGLVILTQLQPISVIFSLPENVISQVVEAQKADAELPSIAFDQADLHRLAAGKLATLDNTIDTTTGMVKARALFDNPDFSLFPNQFVNIHLKVGELHDVIVAPSSAVQRGSVGTFAYVVGSDNKVSVRKVTLGPTQGTTIAITDGLKLGDRVVVDGSDRLRDGATVVVAGAPPAPGSNAAGQKPGDAPDGQKHGHRHRHDQP